MCVCVCFRERDVTFVRGAMYQVQQDYTFFKELLATNEICTMT